MQPWQLISEVSPNCNYKIMSAKDSGVILHFPLPACHSESWVRLFIILCYLIIHGFFWSTTVNKSVSVVLLCKKQSPWNCSMEMLFIEINQAVCQGIYSQKCRRTFSFLVLGTQSVVWIQFADFFCLQQLCKFMLTFEVSLFICF